MTSYTLCKYCRSEIDDTAVICPICRKKQNKFSKKSIIAIIILLLIITIISIFLWNKNKIERNKQLLYLTNVSLFYNSVEYNGISLENIGNNIAQYWYDYIYNNKYESIDDAVQQALIDNSEEIQSVKAEYNSIYDKYTKALTIPNDKTAYTEIKSSVKLVYSSYMQLYKLVTFPTGSYNDFKQNFNEYDTKLAENLNNLITLLKIKQNS